MTSLFSGHIASVIDLFRAGKIKHMLVLCAYGGILPKVESGTMK